MSIFTSIIEAFRNRKKDWLLLLAVIATVVAIVAFFFYNYTGNIIEGIGIGIGAGAFALTFLIAMQQEVTLQKLNERQALTKKELERGRRDYAIEQRASKVFWTSLVRGDKPYICRRLEMKVNDFDMPFTPVAEDHVLNVLTHMLEKCQKRWKTYPYKETSKSSMDAAFLMKHEASMPRDKTNEKQSLESRAAELFEKERKKFDDCPVITFDPHDPIFLEKNNLPIRIMKDRITQDSPHIKWSDSKNQHHAIFGRINHGEARRFIVSGPDQWGTRAVGTFLERLLLDEENDAKSRLSINDEQYNCFLGDSPFLAVIEGLFTEDPKTVTHLDCLSLWREVGEKWEYIGRLPIDEYTT